ncbi:MAG: TIGR00296 family protein [Candidatus Thermoplasmatota archaeon]
MNPLYTNMEGEIAVRLARAKVELVVARAPMPHIQLTPRFSEKSGAFVTLDTYPGHELRGCIGYPEPYFPLREALLRAAEGVVEDPRFPPLRKEELDHIVVEVSILTPPELIQAPNDELPRHIQIGRDGLIVERGGFRGLLLPQVAVEYNWAPEEFLEHTCMKASLPPDAWRLPGTKFYRFGAEVFGEKEPRGKVERREH